MDNETYLKISYFVVLLGSVLVGVVAGALLRGALRRLRGPDPHSNLIRRVRRVVPMMLLLAPFLGFTTVSYYSCNRETYPKIVESREYLVQVNRDQLRAALQYSTVAILLACAAVVAAILCSRPGEKGE